MTHAEPVHIIIFGASGDLAQRKLNVELVQITAAEPIGTEGRGDFYEETGAMRDVMQNHMLQMLALVGMEAPASLDPEDVRGQKVRLLQALHRPDFQGWFRGA